MRTKIFVTTAALLALGFCAGAQGGTAELLSQADGLFKNKEYEAAEAAYKGVVEQGGASEEAFAAERKLCSLYIASGRDGEALAAVEKMLGDFAAHERLPHAVHEVAEESHRLGKAAKIRAVYRQILDARPGHEQAIWLKMGVAISSVFSGDDEQADTAVEEVIEEFGSDSRCAEAVGQVAWSCRKLKRYEDARELHRLAVENWPENERAIFSQRGIILASIALDDDPNAAAEAEKLIEQFGEHKDIAKVVSNVAEAYRNRWRFAEARRWHRYILANHRDSSEAIWSQRGVILSSIMLKDDPNTTSEIATLLREYAGHERMGEVVYQVARNVKLRHPEDAPGLFEYVKRKKAGAEPAILAEANLGALRIRAGDDAWGEAIFAKLMEDFEGHAALAKAVGIMAEAYWERMGAKEAQGRKTRQKAT